MTQPSGPSGPASPATLNIGIVAHVDAGKTSLTERLLYDTGAIGRLGSVDTGDTRTDSGAIERRRGITIRSAVAPLTVDGLRVNLIDTPGHSDFTAELERALGVLDGAVLLLSAVEGVQARTRVLMRILREAAVPALVFVNKTDRQGARRDELLAAMRARLTDRLLPMTRVTGIGTPAARSGPAPAGAVAEALAEHDDDVLAALVDGRAPAPHRLRAAIARHTAAGTLHPLYFGSALTGQGIPELLDGIRHFLPPAHGDPAAAPRGTVFAVERAASGEKTGYLRLYDGTLRVRRRVTLTRHDPDGASARHSGQITGLEVVGADPRDTAPLGPGGIARIRGLPGIRVGDRLGERPGKEPEPRFPPPALETLVRPRRPHQAAALHSALTALADQDPLIGTRTVPGEGISLLLYGEVQKEVVGAVLAEEFGIEAHFAPSRTVYAERPAGSGEACVEMERGEAPEFLATVGLRVDPAPHGSGIGYRLEAEFGSLPPAFHRAVEETVRRTLREGGLHGWPVTDCTVALVRHAWFSPNSTAADFRGLTPIVLRRALAAAGTGVYEPCHAFEAEIPADALGPVSAMLAALGAVVGSAEGDGSGGWLLRGDITARRVPEANRGLPGLTRGEGAWWSHPSGDRPVTGRPYPVRTLSEQP